MEQLDFTVQNNYKVSQLLFNWPDSTMSITLVDSQGSLLICSYTGADATNLMNALNRANFTVKSLHRSALEYLVATGKIPAGSISGNP